MWELDHPRFYPNHLQPSDISRTSLQVSLKDFRLAVRKGVEQIELENPPMMQYDGRGIFDGNLGISLGYLRLAQQASSLEGTNELPLPAFRSLAAQRIPSQGPDIPLEIGLLSPVPMNSPLSAAILRILAKCADGNLTGVAPPDIACISQAIEMAVDHGPVAFYNGHNLGADEIMFGRAGLLWAILNIRTHLYDTPEDVKRLFSPVLDAVPRLLDVIIAAGRHCASEYIEDHGDEHAFPLMWTWFGGLCGLGAVHGITGILSVILACQPEELQSYLPEIGATISGICRLCITHGGHLPMTHPPRPSSTGPSPYHVQICHGSPAILVLLAVARSCAHLTAEYWEPRWDEAIRLATECVWQEGLLSKGGGLCHGIAGNAWSLLLLHDCFEYGQEEIVQAKSNYRQREGLTDDPPVSTMEGQLTGDYFLSRAIAMLLYARETRPYNQSPETTKPDYRMPDMPYSLFEGLAGTVCAWAEACAFIQARLRKMELSELTTNAGNRLEDDELFKQLRRRELGFPTLGGFGATGFL